MKIKFMVLVTAAAIADGGTAAGGTAAAADGTDVGDTVSMATIKSYHFNRHCRPFHLHVWCLMNFWSDQKGLGTINNWSVS